MKSQKLHEWEIIALIWALEKSNEDFDPLSKAVLLKKLENAKSISVTFKTPV